MKFSLKLPLFLLGLLFSPVSANDSFPNIFELLVGKPQFRFQYEINALDSGVKSSARSALVDESFSFKLSAGRLLFDGSESQKELDRNNFFYWLVGADKQEAFWLRPFICVSASAKLDSPINNGVFASLLTKDFENLLTYSCSSHQTGCIFHGLAALLAHVAQRQADSIKKVDSGDKSRFNWQLYLKTGHQLEFSFFRPNVESSFTLENLAGLQIKFLTTSQSNIEHGKTIAQLTLLKVSHNFALDLVRLPQGYSCRQSLPPPIELKESNSVQSGQMKYSLEISVTTDIQSMDQIQHRNHLSVPEPLDSMTKPRVQSSSLIMIRDEFDKTISFVSRLSRNGSKSKRASLTVWDFKSMRKHVVHGQSCEQPKGFGSNLMAGSRVKQVELDSVCRTDAVEVQLSDQFTLGLNANGLKLLTFSLQDRKNYGQLVDFRELEAGNYELDYEMPAHDKLCIYKGDEILALGQVRLVTRFNYSLGQGGWRPKSSSLMFFDKTISKLLFQIDLNLLHQEHFRPWASSRHLIDLSACKLGAKQSAHLELEYSLGRDLLALSEASSANEMIRSALASHFRMAYSIPLHRLPSIEVRIRGDFAQVKLHLLDRAHLLSDSDYMSETKATQTEYLHWLRQATRSVLLKDEQACAEYCEEYECQVYAYCKYLLRCYVFASLTKLQNDNNATFGSFHGLEMNCVAYRVLPDRLDQASAWRKSSWSLEEVLESVVRSIKSDPADRAAMFSIGDDPIENSPSASKLAALKPTLEIALPLGPKASKLVRLNPTFVQYKYDNLQADLVVEQSNPFLFSLDKQQGAIKRGNSQLVNFRVAFSGFNFAETKPILRHHGDINHIDLSDSGGYIILETLELEDCANLCLGDTLCSSFSYCATESQPCILTTLADSDLRLLSGHQQQAEPAPDSAASNLAIREETECAIMQRTYSDQFERLELKMLTGLSGVTKALEVFAASEAEECATGCILNRVGGLSNGTSSTCLSYDFCESISASNRSSVCVLYNRHLVSKNNHSDQIKGDHPAELSSSQPNGDSLLSTLLNEWQMDRGSFCWHYVRNYLADFHRITRRRLPESAKTLVLQNFVPPEEKGDSKQVEAGRNGAERLDVDGGGISLARCALLCEEDPNCGAFEFCKANYEQAPSGLYLACAIGGQATLEMSPLGSFKSRGAASESKLSKSHLCSVFVYKSLALVVGHKKKNLAQLGTRLMGDLADQSNAELLKMIRLDLFVMLLFFLFGFLVRDIDPDRMRFTRLQETFSDARGSISNLARLGAQTVSKSEPEQEPGTNSIRLESLDRKGTLT